MFTAKRNLRLSAEDFKAISHTEMVVQMIRRQFTCCGTHEEIEELTAYLEETAKGSWHMARTDTSSEIIRCLVYLYREEDVKAVQQFEAKHKVKD